MLDKLAKQLVNLVGPVKNSSRASSSHPFQSSGTMGSDGSKMPQGISGSGQSIVFNHGLLLRNGRRAYHETPQAHSIVTRMADTVADTGLRWEPMPNVLTLGITPEEGAEWARNVKQKFDAWSKAKIQHRSGTMNWYQSQRLYQVQQHRDNDVFVRFFYSKDRSLLNPLQFEFMDAAQIRGTAFTSTFGLQTSKDGIIRDPQGREKAYNVWIKNATSGQYEPKVINAKSPSGRLLVLHGFMPEYAGQGRGLSRLGGDVQEFQKITDLTLSEIQKAINQASIWGFVKPSDQEDATSPFAGELTAGGAGPAAENFGSSVTPEEGESGSSGLGLEPLQCYDIPEATMSRPGVFVANLHRGQDIKMVDSKSPATGFDRFVDAFTSYISSAKGIPLEVLLMKFGQNFSASRGALLLFWRVAQIWRDEMAADYLNPTVEMFLSEEIAAGRVFAPGWSDPRLRAAWMNSIWVGPPAPDIDPMKTSKARLNNIESGVTTIDIEARNANGSDAAINKVKLKEEIEGMPIPPWSKGFGVQGGNTELEGLVRQIIENVQDENEE